MFSAFASLPKCQVLRPSELKKFPLLHVGIPVLLLITFSYHTKLINYFVNFSRKFLKFSFGLLVG